MSIIPYLKDSETLSPTRISQHNFGNTVNFDRKLHIMDDLRGMLVRNTAAGFVRPWIPQLAESHFGSTVSISKEEYKAALDVREFYSRGKLSVKSSVINYSVTVEGEIEVEVLDHDGEPVFTLFRHLIRRYVLPKNCNMHEVTAELSDDGILTIVARRENVTDKPIPITKVSESKRPTMQMMFPMESIFTTSGSAASSSQ